MREIKFRGISLIDHTPDDMLYCIFKGDMVTGLLAKAGENAWIIGSVVEATEDYIAIESWIPVDPATVGQYTGMKDKNWKEIFEGDIARCDQGEDRGTARVEYAEGAFLLIPMTGRLLEKPIYEYWLNDWDLEVIGNIHENPALLEDTSCDR